MASAGVLLLTILVFIALMSIDWTVLSGVIAALSLGGFVLGLFAEKQISRRMGLMQGDGPALVGKWGNLSIFVIIITYFVWSLSLYLYRIGLS